MIEKKKRAHESARGKSQSFQFELKSFFSIQKKETKSKSKKFNHTLREKSNTHTRSLEVSQFRCGTSGQ